MPQSILDALIPKYKPPPGQSSVPSEPSSAQLAAREERDKRIRWTQEAEHATAPLWERALNNATDFAGGILEGLAGFSDELYSGKGEKTAHSLGNIAGETLPGLGAAAKGIATAAGFIPPKYIKGLANSLTRKIDTNPAFPGKEIALKTSQQFPTSSAHISDVRGMNAKDLINSPGLAQDYQGVYTTIPEYNPAARRAIRNDPASRRYLEEIIETPDYRDLSPEAREYWDNRYNFGIIRVNPDAGNPALGGTYPLDELIPHEFSHAGQFALNRVKPSWFELPTVIQPHEIGANVTARMRANPEAGLNYNEEILKELNKYAGSPIRRREWDEVLDVFNKRMEKSGKHIVPIRNTPDAFTEIGRHRVRARLPYKRFEIQSLNPSNDSGKLIITP